MNKVMFLIVGFIFSNAVLAQNIIKEKLPNGVIVNHLTQTDGSFPTSSSSKVTVTYVGTFKDGQVFDKSEKPITFPLNGVIPCWTTGVMKMRVGETAKLECPSDTAYGVRGAPPSIPPNTPLDFEVKLLSVNS